MIHFGNWSVSWFFDLLFFDVVVAVCRWVWGPGGFLGELGTIDIAGSGAVHLLGGASGNKIAIHYLLNSIPSLL